MKRYFIFISMMVCVLTGCTEPSGAIVFEENNSLSPFEKLVSEITLVPLEDDDEHLLGDGVNLLVSEEGFILYDAYNTCIYRYSPDGRFMNTIGMAGRGPSEYTQINGVQIIGDNVNVYAPMGDILTYTIDGTLVDRKTENDLSDKTWSVGSGYLAYNGYGSVSGHKAAFISEGKTTYFMPTDAKVIHLTPRYNIFCDIPDGVTFIDSYTNDIYLFSHGEISEYRKFDFGQYSLPKEFFEYEDSFAAMEMMLSSTFALIQSYQESGDKAFVDVMIQSSETASRYYGLSADEKWSWFSLGGQDDAFAGASCVLENDVLYFVLDPAKISTFPKSLEKKLSNPEVLKTISPDSNFLIACVRLTH